MNKRDWIILAILVNSGYENHRNIVRRTGFSLGLVNSSLKKLVEEGYIDTAFNITDKTRAYIEQARPKRAVILAAGMGLRMVPINTRLPKGLVKVNGEPLIERIIKQLQAVGVNEIYVVAGYLMERLDYLVDKYNVEMVYDHDFSRRDSMHSLRMAVDKLSNCYIVPSNVWFAKNPFNTHEYFSWYAVAEYMDDDSYVRLNRKMELVYTEDENGGNAMVGLCYLMEEEAAKVKEQIIRFDRMRKYNRATWERALYDGNKMMVYARVMLGQTAFEIKTYEQLRELDSQSQDLQSKRISLISEVLQVDSEEITDISALFAGMTNRLMRFSVHGKPYIFRVPGEGSNELTSRKQEAEVYNALEGKGLTEKVLYISPDTGIKIAEFLEGSRVCNPGDGDDVAACMKHLRKLHDMKLEVDHSFDMRGRLETYENLRDGESSFTDYLETRKKVAELFDLLDQLPKDVCLCHVDPVGDNFLFVGEDVYLIDWEYAGMCEPPVDLAMFCIYADYDKESMDHVIDLYYQGRATDVDRFKVYAYAAASGLLWAVWCEYKEKMGVTFGQYAVKQYRYAKRFYKHAMAIKDRLPVKAEAGSKA